MCIRRIIQIIEILKFQSYNLLISFLVPALSRSLSFFDISSKFNLNYYTSAFIFFSPSYSPISGSCFSFLSIPPLYLSILIFYIFLYLIIKYLYKIIENNLKMKIFDKKK